MTEQNLYSIQLTSLAEQYLGLESMEITEALLDLCGARIDLRALPLLKQRLQEEKVLASSCTTRGYIRMGEKSQQLVESLTSLITFLEQTTMECDV